MLESAPITIRWLKIDGQALVPLPHDQPGIIPLHSLCHDIIALTAWQDDSPVAMVGVLSNNNKLSVTVPDNSLHYPPASDRIADDPWRLIIRAVRNVAAQVNIPNLEVLVPDEDLPGTPFIRRSLIRSGLKQQATIGCWERNGSDEFSDTPPTPTVSALPAKVVCNDTSLREQMLQLLQRVLENSIDLANIESPTPEQLLAEWLDSDAILLVEFNASEIPVAVCCCVNHDGNPRCDSPRTVEIRYLGVHPDWRRQGAAYRLTQAAAHFAITGKLPAPFPHLNHNTELPPTFTDFARLEVNVDEDNTPAVSLYKNTNFVCTRRLQLWTSKVPADSSGRSLPNQF
ncbi:MAG: hypothetical protein RLZZ458_1597 [Planctomycetota bacterium]|jgi:ribosomal protein S18 acetylase RimI-like enzyme